MITPKLTGRNYRIGRSVRSQGLFKGNTQNRSPRFRGEETTPHCFRLTYTAVDQDFVEQILQDDESDPPKTAILILVPKGRRELWMIAI